MSSQPPASSLSWFWRLFGTGETKEKTNAISIPKYPAAPTDVNLAVALQYGTATGLPQLQKAINEFVEKVFDPAYADWTTLAHTGNTDGCVLPSRPAASGGAGTAPGRAAHGVCGVPTALGTTAASCYSFYFLRALMQDTNGAGGPAR